MTAGDFGVKLSYNNEHVQVLKESCVFTVRSGYCSSSGLYMAWHNENLMRNTSCEI